MSPLRSEDGKRVVTTIFPASGNWWLNSCLIEFEEFVTVARGQWWRASVGGNNSGVTMKLWKTIRDRWPWVSRKRLDKAKSEVDMLRAQIINANNRHDRELKEASANADKLVKSLSKMTVTGDVHGGYAIMVTLDRRMVHEVARHNDKGLWRYLSESAARNLERELATLNFAGIERAAREVEYERYRRY